MPVEIQAILWHDLNTREIFLWPAETEVMVSPLCLVCGST